MPLLPRWTLAVCAGAAALVVATALPASAHVTVSPASAVQGSFTTLTFEVPNEKDGASTTQIDLYLPTGTPIPVVQVKPLAGWRVAVEQTTLPTPYQSDDGPITKAVSHITWTATSAADAIGPAEFQQFQVSAGPLPKTGRLVFKVLQTYSDQSVARWIDVPTGGQEPENPAPVLTLSRTAAAAGPVTRSTSDGTTAIDVVALVAGLLGLVAGVAALVVRRPRRD